MPKDMTMAFLDIEATTLHEVLGLCKRATMLTYHSDGSLSVTINGPIYRLVARLPARRDRLHLVVLTGYDPEKHCWTKECGQTCAEIGSKRGQKALNSWLESLNLKHHPYPRPRIACYFRKDGELRP